MTLSNGPRFAFHIIEKNPLFSRDLSEGLQAACASSTAQIHRDIAQAMQAICDSRNKATAISRPVIVLAGSISELDASGMTRLAAQIEAIIVLREGADPPDAVAARSWLSLPCPFTADAFDRLSAQLPLQ